jgi:hypothetical protein
VVAAPSPVVTVAVPIVANDSAMYVSSASAPVAAADQGASAAASVSIAQSSTSTAVTPIPSVLPSAGITDSSDSNGVISAANASVSDSGVTEAQSPKEVTEAEVQSPKEVTDAEVQSPKDVTEAQLPALLPVTLNEPDSSLAPESVSESMSYANVTPSSSSSSHSIEEIEYEEVFEFVSQTPSPGSSPREGREWSARAQLQQLTPSLGMSFRQTRCVFVPSKKFCPPNLFLFATFGLIFFMNSIVRF